MAGLTYGLQNVKKALCDWIQSEIKEEGLLRDVETFLYTFNTDDYLDSPIIWLYEESTKPTQDKSGAISQKMYLTSTFMIVCIDYDDDIPTAEEKSKNLASRTVNTILKHKKRNIEDKLVITGIHLKEFQPVGEATIINQNDKVPATAIIMDIDYIIDWFKCCKNT